MLTKDLIRCRAVKGRLHPQFIAVDNEEMLSLAESLLSAYVSEEHPLRSDIEEVCESLVNGSSKVPVARGIWKIVEDRSEFSGPSDLDYPAERMRLFDLAAQLIRSGSCPEEGAFQRLLREQAAGSPLLECDSLFADLPDNDRLTGFRSLTARQVLERYNVGQVQGLLLRASKMTVVVSDSEPARLRRLLSYVKFFRLLCSASRDQKTQGIRLEIDGPASILEQSKRYGLQLANFFPAVCGLKQWEMTAEVEWKEHSITLQLDHKSKLVCPYHNRVAWVPEEIELFERHFREAGQGWTLLEEAPYLECENGELVFPDFSFSDSEGRIVQLELFHRWHAGQVLRRLEYCEQHPELSLVMGVDRWLLKDEELAAKLDSSLWFVQHGYYFRDYPTVEKTLKALASVAVVKERRSRK